MIIGKLATACMEARAGKTKENAALEDTEAALEDTEAALEGTE